MPDPQKGTREGRVIYLIESPASLAGTVELLDWLRDQGIGGHICAEGCICVLSAGREVKWPASVKVHAFGSAADLHEHLAGLAAQEGTGA